MDFKMMTVHCIGEYLCLVYEKLQFLGLMFL